MTDEKYELETLKVEPDDIVKITFKDFPIKEAMDFFGSVKSQFPDNTVIAVFEDSCDITVEKPVVKTKYDRIKNMSVEEMADFINSIDTSNVPMVMGEPIFNDDDLMDWLNSEVKNENN